MATLKWNGRSVKNRVAAASRMGVDKVTSECVSDARRDHPWKSQTGFEDAAITMAPAVLEGNRVVGKWGAYTEYSLWLEIGTSRIGPTAFEREASSDGMWTIPGPKPEPGQRVEQGFTILPPGSMKGQEGFVTIDRPSEGVGPLMEPRPFLRPAADMNYGFLAEWIGMAYRGEAL